LTVVLPPLRERMEDVVPLFLRLLDAHSGGRPPSVEPKLVEALLLHDWPFNVRELVRLVQRLLAVHGHEPAFKRAMLPEHMFGAKGESKSARPRRSVARVSAADDAAFDDLLRALRESAGNVAHASVALGISRARAYRLMDAKPGFDLRSLRDPPKP